MFLLLCSLLSPARLRAFHALSCSHLTSFAKIFCSKDSVDSLGEVRLGGPGRVCPFGEIQVGQLGPYLAVVKFLMGFRDWSGGLGWEVVVPCEDMI